MQKTESMTAKDYTGDFILLTDFSANTAEIYQAWDLNDDRFELKSVCYDEAIVAQFKNIMLKFYKKDAEAATSTHFPSMEQYEIFINAQTDQRATWLKEEKASLIIVTKNKKIVGGMYYLLEDNHKILRMANAGFDETELTTEQNNVAKVKTIDVLSSRRYFPKAEKIVVFLRNYSAHIVQLKTKLGFQDSLYTVPEYPQQEYCCLERATK